MSAGTINGREYRSVIAGIPLAEPSSVPVLWWYREHSAGGIEHRYIIVTPDGRQPMSGTLWEAVTVGLEVSEAVRRTAELVRRRLVEIDREACAYYGESLARVRVDIIGEIVHVADDRPRAFDADGIAVDHDGGRDRYADGLSRHE